MNAHLNCLQWIDSNTAQVQNKLQEVSKQFITSQAEQERLLGLRKD